MVVKWSNSVNIRINPLNGAVVSSPSPTGIDKLPESLQGLQGQAKN